MLISIPTLISCRFRCPDTKTESSPIPQSESKSFSTAAKKTIGFDQYTEIKSSYIPHIEIKLISTIHTKTKSISMPALKPSDFRPAYKAQVNFDHSHKNKPVVPYTIK